MIDINVPLKVAKQIVIVGTAGVAANATKAAILTGMKEGMNGIKGMKIDDFIK